VGSGHVEGQGKSSKKKTYYMANFSKFRARGAKIRLNTNTKEGTINFLKMMSEVDGGREGRS
jgi:hypothetical protein